MGRLARAFQASGAASASIEKAGKVSQSHGEHDSQRVFRKFGLSLAVPISHVDVPETPESSSMLLPVLKVSEYLKLLLRRHPRLLFGGADFGSQSAQTCKAFWQQYRSFQPDHIVYTSCGENEWGNILPICLHGDKGRTRSKLPIFNFSFESVFGLPPEVRERKDLPKRAKTVGNLITISTMTCAPNGNVLAAVRNRT